MDPDTDAAWLTCLDKALEKNLNQEKPVKPLKRKPVNKSKSAAKFRRMSRKTKAANAPMRGGYRF